jgi:hypothetical protein
VGTGSVVIFRSVIALGNSSTESIFGDDVPEGLLVFHLFVEFRLDNPPKGIILNPGNAAPGVEEEVEEVGIIPAVAVTCRANVDIALNTPRADLHILNSGRSCPVPTSISSCPK